METVIEYIDSTALSVPRENDHLPDACDLQKSFFASGKTLPVSFRKEQLKKLRQLIIENDSAIVEALQKDLGKSEFEAFASEIGQVLKEIDHTLSNLKRWAAPKRVATPLMFFPSTSKVYPDPLGNILIIGPWNYPFLLLMSPLVSAIAGGNTAILKPSEEASHTAGLVARMINGCFDSNYIHVVEGIGAELIPKLIKGFRFDHIFFTGSTIVGQKIMEMAATKLVPVTLELGGKSPCIVDPSANLEYAARKIAWSKLMNAGQTCVAPDYLLVHESIKSELISKLKDNFRKMLGEDPSLSKDYGRIINKKRFSKLVSYLGEGNIISGGRYDEDKLYIEPTIIGDVDTEDQLMKEEIFGPLLPIISYREKEEVLAWVDKNPFPLSIYIYADNTSVQEFYISRLRFGGCSINNGLIHLGNPNLPFGGVGPSGTGQYHGKYGFDTFTRPKAVMHSRSWFDLPVWYAPFGKKVKLVRSIFKLT